MWHEQSIKYNKVLTTALGMCKFEIADMATPNTSSLNYHYTVTLFFIYLLQPNMYF